MDGGGGGLDHIAILPADTGLELDVEVLVGELADIPTAQVQVKVVRNFLREIRGTGSGEKFDVPEK
jgi:hypothetical protein